MSKRWYVVHAYSGFEKHVMRSLIERVKMYGMEDPTSNLNREAPTKNIYKEYLLPIK